jgi:hypothetical protein
MDDLTIDPEREVFDIKRESETPTRRTFIQRIFDCFRRKQYVHVLRPVDDFEEDVAGYPIMMIPDDAI